MASWKNTLPIYLLLLLLLAGCVNAVEPVETDTSPAASEAEAALDLPDSIDVQTVAEDQGPRRRPPDRRPRAVGI